MQREMRTCSRCRCVAHHGGFPVPPSAQRPAVIHACMQGKCSTGAKATPEVTGAPLRELLPGQCLLIADRQLLELHFGRLWLDNVYIRLQPPEATQGTLSAVVAADGGEMWVTRTTIQGDGSTDTQADEEQPTFGVTALASTARLYAHGTAATSSSPFSVMSASAALADMSCSG
jgi:hypothetical protein